PPRPCEGPAMRFGIALPSYGPLATADTLARLARVAEDAGIDSVWVSDHLVAPVGSRTIYPYDRRPDAKPGDMGVIERFYEPMTTLAWLAGRTRRVRLGVSAWVLAYRNPVVAAKVAATLDDLSGGRLVLAVGTGWLREEFEAVGAPFAARGARMEESLAIMGALWRGGEARFDGRHHRLPPVRTGRGAVQRPRPPIWSEANSAQALDRAARLGATGGTRSTSPRTSSPRGWRRSE